MHHMQISFSVWGMRPVRQPPAFSSAGRKPASLLPAIHDGAFRNPLYEQQLDSSSPIFFPSFFRVQFRDSLTLL